MDNTQQRRDIIGKRIRQLRQNLNLTLAECGKLVDIGPSRLSNWEQGIRMAPIIELQKLAKLFGVSPAYLSGHVDDIGSYDGYTLPTGSDNFALSKEWLRRHRFGADSAVCVLVKDTDCEPTIPVGSECVVNTKERWTATPAYMAIRVGQFTTIAHVTPDGEDHYIIRGKRTHKSEINFVGKVHMVVNTFQPG